MASSNTVERQKSVVGLGEWIGIIGSGQLGRLLALSALKMGFRCAIYSEDAHGTALEIVNTSYQCDYNDAEFLDEFSRLCSVITYETENLPLGMLEYLAQRRSLHPSSIAIEVMSDRLIEKVFLQTLRIPVTPFRVIAYEGDLRQALDMTDKGLFLKTRHAGYDGKGQAYIAKGDDMHTAYTAIGEQPAISEEPVDFSKEFSLVMARGYNGECVFYDPACNVHQDGILHHSIVPAGLSDQQIAQARDYTRRVAETLRYVGVMAMEFFLDKKGKIIVNEIAPRVHNSGHWTMDACSIDQFDLHIRAIAGWSLPEPIRYQDVHMYNLLGEQIKDWNNLVTNADIRLYSYDKTITSSRRKMGHYTQIISP